MENNHRVFKFCHNSIGVIITVLSFIFFFKEGTTQDIVNVCIWASIAGVTYRLVFDLKIILFFVGSLFLTAAIFVFPWWGIPSVYIIARLVYKFSCLIKDDGTATRTRKASREIFITLNLIITGVMSSIVRYTLLPHNILNLTEDILPMLLVCITESLIGLIFIYLDLKQREKISAIFINIAEHLKETYDIYIIYMLITINTAIMYQNYGLIGLIVASSYAVSLKVAYTKQAKATQVESESYTDVLTKVKNKKFYIEGIPDELNNSCAVFFIDFNDFKGINDTYGHDVGDKVIILGGEILSRAVRDKDEVIRFGGDEFMLLVRDADRDVCKEVIKRINTLCEENPYKEKDIEIKVSMAIGIAICPEESNNKDELSNIADSKMYFAKKEKDSSIQELSSVRYKM